MTRPFAALAAMFGLVIAAAGILMVRADRDVASIQQSARQPSGDGTTGPVIHTEQIASGPELGEEADASGTVDVPVDGVEPGVELGATGGEPTGERVAVVVGTGAASLPSADLELAVEGEVIELPRESADTSAGTASLDPLPQLTGISLEPEPAADTSIVVDRTVVLLPRPDLQVSARAEDEGAASVIPHAFVVLEPLLTPEIAIRAAEAEAGAVYVAGVAAPGATVRVFAEGEYFGAAVAAEEGTWLVEGKAELPPGRIVVRAEGEPSADPQSSAPVEAAFYRAPDTIVLAPVTAEANLESGDPVVTGSLPLPTYVIIRRGDNLWRISRRNYGRGIRYEAIFEANRDLIENPHRIFPGEVFVLPEYDRRWVEAPN